MKKARCNDKRQRICVKIITFIVKPDSYNSLRFIFLYLKRLWHTTQAVNIDT